MIRETTRDAALSAAATGRTAFVIHQKNGNTETVNLTRLLNEVLIEKDNIFLADIEVEPELPPPLKADIRPVKPPKPRRGRHSLLDDGKILALHLAGWSAEKIAEELDVTPETIRGHLFRMREEGKL